MSDGPTMLALKRRNRNDQLDLTRPDRQQRETTFLAPEPNHIARLADAALQLVGMQAAVKDGLAPNKTARWY